MGKTFTTDPQVMSDTSKKLLDISANYRDISAQLMEKAQTMGAAWEAMADHLQRASETLAQQSNNYKTHCDDNSSQVKKLAN